MNTVMSSQNHAMKTNTVKTSTKKLRKVKPSLTNSIAILHVSDAQNGRGPVIAQLQLPNYPDGSSLSPRLKRAMRRWVGASGNISAPRNRQQPHTGAWAYDRSG